MILTRSLLCLRPDTSCGDCYIEKSACGGCSFDRTGTRRYFICGGGKVRLDHYIYRHPGSSHSPGYSPLTNNIHTVLYDSGNNNIVEELITWIRKHQRLQEAIVLRCMSGIVGHQNLTALENFLIRKLTYPVYGIFDARAVRFFS